MRDALAASLAKSLKLDEAKVKAALDDLAPERGGHRHPCQPLVLVVDDEASVRVALERALRLEGFAVSTAAGGREALEAVAQRPPAVIVLDVTMPDLDGVSVVRRLRAGGIDVPVCILPRATRSTTASPACRRGRTITWSSRSRSRS